MSFTQTELDVLRKAYASGALRIVHEGKTVEYGSEADLLRRIRMIEQEIRQTSTGSSSSIQNFSFGSFRRG